MVPSPDLLYPAPDTVRDAPSIRPGQLRDNRTSAARRDEAITMARTVQCVKLRKEAEGLDFPPLPGDLGKRVLESVSKPAWQQWLAHQTMLINENRLKVTDPEARRFLEGELERYFFGEGSATPEGYVPPEE